MSVQRFSSTPRWLAILFTAALVGAAPAQQDTTAKPNTGKPNTAKPDTARGDRMIAEYFRLETARLRDKCLADIQSLDDWKTRREQLREELLEMLGLNPAPEKTDLQATITGTSEHQEFVVERLHFQSRPGLYVTGNLYRPKVVQRPLPAILYVCGHGGVKKDGVSYGNKVHYQHHGAWFARNGYVCLTIDTLQLGEIEGIHHGTYRENMWWWLNRGYTPAGVEAWNCVRALDYLQSRREVDPQRLGVTGRSGGGAYSWWIAAIDERIQCAVPVAGITDLTNHVVGGHTIGGVRQRLHDGCVEGHCDCMYMLNTYGWDYPLVAALVAPRPLLISNTDTDGIFPLDGVVRTFESARRIYALHGQSNKIALNITAGGHQDTQELRVHAFRWFNQHLQGDGGVIVKTAEKFFEPEQLRVFQELPKDQKNTTIQETFVAASEPPAAPARVADWERQRDAWRTQLRDKTFRAWPEASEPLEAHEAFAVEREGVALRAIDFASQNAIGLRLYIAQRAGLKQPELIVLNVLDEPGWTEFLATMRPAFQPQLAGESLPPADEPAFKELQGMFRAFPWAMAYLAPRGIGPTAWNPDERKQTHHRRRFYLLGQTLDGMRAFDVRRAMQTIRRRDDLADTPLWLQAERQMAGVALYASLFEPDVTRLDLHQLPRTHRDGPYFLNVNRWLDMPQAVAMATERSKVVIYQDGADGWDYPAAVAKLLGRDKSLQIRKNVAKGE